MAPVIKVPLLGHAKDAAVNSVSVSMSISVPLMVSLTAINTSPWGLPFLSLRATTW